MHLKNSWQLIFVPIGFGGVHGLSGWKKLPELDFETRSPKINVKHPEGKINEEILAEIERKVVFMIEN
jgi:hypothetical protein